jgi:hypothetical protein
MWPDAEDVEMVTGLNEFPVIRKTKRTPISSLVDDSVRTRNPQQTTEDSCTCYMFDPEP